MTKKVAPKPPKKRKRRAKFTNILYTADNLHVMNGLNSESVDLIYLDPPFNSKRIFSAPIGSKAAGAAFKDMWSWADVDKFYLQELVEADQALVDYIQSIQRSHGKAMMAYITYMAERIMQMHRLLKPTGSIYLHCDQTAGHYLKVLMDHIFGKQNFRNNVVWCYKENETATRYFPKKHDDILFYTKNRKYTFTVQRGEITEAQRKRYSHVDEEGNLWANMKGKWRMLEGGAKVRDWWEIPIAQSAERTGYPTQKPLALLHRIIQASSNEGDIVLDPFCGCATTCVAAQQLHRHWIGIDIEKKARDQVAMRLADDAGRLFTDFVHTKELPQRTDVVKIAVSDKKLKQRLYKEQQGKCNGCYGEFDIWHLEVDHKIPKSRGGGDYKENYQLLCGNCNRIKGNRTMEFLRAKIEKRRKDLNHKVSFGD